MATRFYMSPHRLPPFFLASHATWDTFDTAPSKLGVLTTMPEGIAGYETAFGNKPVTTNPWDVLGMQLVSDPVPAAVTLSGTFKIVFACKENNAAADFFLQTTVSVANGDCTINRGDAYAGQTALTASAVKTDPNYEWTVNTHTVRMLSVTLTSVAMQAGDRVVVCIGARGATAVSGWSLTINLTDREDAAGDLPEIVDFTNTNINTTNGTAAAVRPWCEFSADLFPQTAVPEVFRFGPVGVEINGAVAAGQPFVDLDTIEGLDSVPYHLSTVNKEDQHGGYVSSEFEGIRTVTLTGVVYAPPTALDAYLNKLKVNFAPSRRDKPLFFGSDEGVSYFVMGKSQGFRYSKSRDRSFGKVPFQVQIVCQDPRIYLTSAYLPTVLNLENPAGTYPTSISHTLSGTRESNAVIDVWAKTGLTVVDPQVLLTSDYGETFLKYTGTLTDVDMITVDLAARTVVKNMMTNVRNITSHVGNSKWTLPSPGVNDFSISRASGSVNARIRIRPAWR